MNKNTTNKEMTAEALEAFAAEIETLIVANKRKEAAAKVKEELSDFLATNFVNQVEMIMAYRNAQEQAKDAQEVDTSEKCVEEPSEPVEGPVSNDTESDVGTPVQD